MITKHILLEKAFIYEPKQENIENETYVYNNSLGYWVKKDDGRPAVYDPEFSGPRTKKEDIETGEDQKGE